MSCKEFDPRWKDRLAVDDPPLCGRVFISNERYPTRESSEEIPGAASIKVVDGRGLRVTDLQTPRSAGRNSSEAFFDSLVGGRHKNDPSDNFMNN